MEYSYNYIQREKVTAYFCRSNGSSSSSWFIIEFNEFPIIVFLCNKARRVIDNFSESTELSVFAILVLVFTAHVQVQLWPSCRAGPSAVRDSHAAYIPQRQLM